LLFNLKSLAYFNGEKIKPNERNLNFCKHEASIDLIKENAWTISNRPRNLSYLFVTELINEKNAEFSKYKFNLEKAKENLQQKKINNETEDGETSFNEIANNLNNYYSIVNIHFFIGISIEYMLNLF
jgi:hypothetical protein